VKFKKPTNILKSIIIKAFTSSSGINQKTCEIGVNFRMSPEDDKIFNNVWVFLLQCERIAIPQSFKQSVFHIEP